MAYAPPSIGPAGLTIPAYADIQADNIAQFLKIYGQNEYVGIDSAIYQFISILSLKNSDALKALQYAYNQSSPNTAVGAGLDRIVKLNGLVRKPYTFSSVILTITGTPGTVIPIGSIAQDSNGNQWSTVGAVTIPGGGNINVTANATLPGSVTALAGTITIIATPIGGWTSVTNAAAATPGTPIETDSQLRARQAISVSLPSKTMYSGTVAAIAALSGVGRYFVEENPTGAQDANQCPAHSITAVVEFSSAAAIAQAIYQNRGIGCLTNGQVNGVNVSGTTTVNVADPITGFVLPISFINPPTYVPIFVSISYHLLNSSTPSQTAAIQTAIVNYLNSLAIGELVTLSALYAAAMAVNPSIVSPLFKITALTFGTTASPSGQADVTMLFYQVAQTVAANVVVTSV